MCPYCDDCGFYAKFSKLRHDRLQKMIAMYCGAEKGCEKCVHYQSRFLFDMQLDANICPTCTIIPTYP